MWRKLREVDWAAVEMRVAFFIVLIIAAAFSAVMDMVVVGELVLSDFAGIFH